MVSDQQTTVPAKVQAMENAGKLQEHYQHLVFLYYLWWGGGRIMPP